MNITLASADEELEEAREMFPVGCFIQHYKTKNVYEVTGHSLFEANLTSLVHYREVTATARTKPDVAALIRNKADNTTRHWARFYKDLSATVVVAHALWDSHMVPRFSKVEPKMDWAPVEDK